MEYGAWQQTTPVVARLLDLCYYLILNRRKRECSQNVCESLVAISCWALRISTAHLPKKSTKWQEENQFPIENLQISLSCLAKVDGGYVEGLFNVNRWLGTRVEGRRGSW